MEVSEKETENVKREEMSTAMAMSWTRLVVTDEAAQAFVIKFEKSTSRVFLIIVSTVFKLSETKCSLLCLN